MEEKDNNPTDKEITQEIKRVIFGLAKVCQKGFKSDDIRALAALINSSTLHENSQFLFAATDPKSLWSVAALMREEYGICQECPDKPNCDPTIPICKQPP